jgi:hypothetical protein
MNINNAKLLDESPLLLIKTSVVRGNNFKRPSPPPPRRCKRVEAAAKQEREKGKTVSLLINFDLRCTVVLLFAYVWI